MSAKLRQAIIVAVVLSSSLTLAQNWKQVHKKDEEKWAKATGLDPNTVHRIWRSASSVPENDDDSRIADLDLEGLAERHDVLLVTYAGEKNCLTITVFRQLSENKFEKISSLQPPPDTGGFCDTDDASAKAYAEGGAVMARVPRSTPQGVDFTLYRYEWNGITYRLAGKKDMAAQ
jgi:hypothetical protein